MIIEDPALDDHSRWPITINNDMAAHSNSDVFEEAISDDHSDAAPFEMGVAEFGMWLVWLGAAALSLALFAAKVAAVAAAARSPRCLPPRYLAMDCGPGHNYVWHVLSWRCIQAGYRAMECVPGHEYVLYVL